MYLEKPDLIFVFKPSAKNNEILRRRKVQVDSAGPEVYQEFLSGTGLAQKAYFLQKLGVVHPGFLIEEALAYVEEQGSFNNKTDILVKNQRIKDMTLVGKYRAKRLQSNMPVRGQRTHTNAKTRRKRLIF